MRHEARPGQPVRHDDGGQESPPNPWVTAATWASPALKSAAAEPDVHVEVPLTGLPAPHRAVPTPPHGTALESCCHQGDARLWWLGAHGGAGESTLEQLLPGSRAADHAWPDLGSDAPSVVLVSRTSVHGLERARGAAQQWAAATTPPVRLLGLVTVADAPGRLPPPLSDLLKLTRGAVPRAWHLPWSEALRLGAEPSSIPQPRALRRLLADVSHLTSLPTTSAHIEGAPHDDHLAARR